MLEEKILGIKGSRFFYYRFIKVFNLIPTAPEAAIGLPLIFYDLSEFLLTP